MLAAQIAAALGGKREGHEWRCPCPRHGGHSLLVADGREGKVLVRCFGGCEWHEIFYYLRRLGIMGGDPGNTAGPERARERHRHDRAEIERLRRGICAARDLYHRAKPATGTPVETYLRSRGIVGPIPPVLRFLEACPHRNGRYYPAMIAPIVDVAANLIAIHKTFLGCDGSGKAGLSKQEQRETRGPMKGGAVRLAQHRPDLDLIVGEGIESTLSAMQMFVLPGWAALCADGIEALALPRNVRSVAIAADNDVNSVGQKAALSARGRWIADGRAVRILLPSNTGEDFNDVLLSAE